MKVILIGLTFVFVLTLIFVNDFKKLTKFLDPKMFADDTNLFYSNKDINTLFKITNEELNEIKVKQYIYFFINNKTGKKSHKNYPC